MGIGKALRERCAGIRTLVDLQKTAWYPALFAVLCTIAGMHGHTVFLPILCLLTLCILFSALFADDNKVFLTPLVMIFYSLGIDTDTFAFFDSKGDLLSFYRPTTFAAIMIICVLCVGVLLTRLCADGSIKRIFQKRRFFTRGILLLDVAFLLNGLFGARYTPLNLLYGAVLALGLTVVYFLVSGMLEGSHDPMTYACRVMVATSYVAFSQSAFVAWRLFLQGDLLMTDGGGLTVINRSEFVLGWGISTVISAVMALGIPAAMYLAKNGRHPVLSYLSACLLMVGVMVTNGRSAILAGGLILGLCVVLCCVFGKNRRCNRVITGVLGGIGGVSIGGIFLWRPDLMRDLVKKGLHLFRLTDTLSYTERVVLWKDGWQDLLSSPIFGIGIHDGARPDATRYVNPFSNMYHNIAVQFGASMGVFGIAAFLGHMCDMVRMFFKKCNINKMMLLLVPLMILFMSLMDNFFFYFNFQIIYCVFLACAEKSDESYIGFYRNLS